MSQEPGESGLKQASDPSGESATQANPLGSVAVSAMDTETALVPSLMRLKHDVDDAHGELGIPHVGEQTDTSAVGFEEPVGLLESQDGSSLQHHVSQGGGATATAAVIESVLPGMLRAGEGEPFNPNPSTREPPVRYASTD